MFLGHVRVQGICPWASESWFQARGSGLKVRANYAFRVAAKGYVGV